MLNFNNTTTDEQPTQRMFLDRFTWKVTSGEGQITLSEKNEVTGNYDKSTHDVILEEGPGPFEGPFEFLLDVPSAMIGWIDFEPCKTVNPETGRKNPPIKALTSLFTDEVGGAVPEQPSTGAQKTISVNILFDPDGEALHLTWNLSQSLHEDIINFIATVEDSRGWSRDTKAPLVRVEKTTRVQSGSGERQRTYKKPKMDILKLVNRPEVFGSGALPEDDNNTTVPSPLGIPAGDDEKLPF